MRKGGVKLFKVVRRAKSAKKSKERQLKKALSFTPKKPKKRMPSVSWKELRDQQRHNNSGKAPGLIETPLPGTEQFASYPSFHALFEKNANGTFRYDVLWSLTLEKTQELRDLFHTLDQACQQSKFPDQELMIMLSERDWRPHLVAAATLAIEGGSQKVFDALWNTIDQGSRVGPHLAAAASLTDEKFESQARVRIEQRCLVAPPKKLLTTVVSKKEKKKRKEQTIAPSPQMLSSLLTLSRQCPGAMQWLIPHLADPEVSHLLDSDTRGGGALSLFWKERLLEALASISK